MNKQIIQNIMEFMMRVQLTGQEVPAFNAAMNALQKELDSPLAGDLGTPLSETGGKMAERVA